MSGHGQRCGQRSGVATPPGGCDLDCPEWCRDTNLMSRHGASFQEVATWNDVATWPGGRLPGRVTTSARTACARPALAARVTRARQAFCASSSAHDMGTASAVCARPGFWVCTLCTKPSFVIVHCLGLLFGHCSWTLFKNTVHKVKKKKKNKQKEYKIFKNFLGGDLIYMRYSYCIYYKCIDVVCEIFSGV